MTTPALHYGRFRNGVPFLKFGTGTRTLLFLVGGPGNILPRGLAATGFIRGIRSFADEYTIYLVSRKSGLPAGYTTRDMANDYAEMIRDDFGGHADLLVGFSYGGLIAQHFAADHATLCGHIVIGGAAHRVSEAALRIDSQFATLIHQGQDRRAMAMRAAAVVQRGPLQQLLAGILWLFGKTLLGPVDETFRRDVLIEAEAERAHDATESLSRIQVPVLVVCGKNDFAFPESAVTAMAAMIPAAQLKIYDRGHSTVFFDPRFREDVRQFTTRPQSPP